MTDRKINLDAIAEAAGKATPGRLAWTVVEKANREELLEWFKDHLSHSESNESHGVGAMDHPSTVIGSDPMAPEHLVTFAECGNGPNGANNARHIALNDPATSLAFVEVVRAMKQARETLSIAMDTEPNEWTHVDRDELRRVHGIVCAALQPFVDGEVG